MSLPFFGFMVFCFIGATLWNRIMEGAMIATADMTILNNLTAFTTVKIWLITIPVVNPDFFTTGIPQIIAWNYTFFGGNAGIIQYFLYSLSAMMVMAIFVIILGTIFYYIAKFI